MRSPVASVSASHRCCNEGQCSCDSGRNALAIESLVVDRRREAAAAVGPSHRAAARCLPSVSLVAAVHAHRTQFSRSQREGMHGPVAPRAAAAVVNETHSLPVAALVPTACTTTVLYFAYVMFSM
ncbi:unnamed protein product [Chrysodeixis includens]|uniref:Uncharacterized protein n=1 Tax=Chrysodeixis includens TaxID=689277 RepID=A0A9N8KX21_CHRIL|nr:unnamed protein product [Chrysodeixis includens]